MTSRRGGAWLTATTVLVTMLSLSPLTIAGEQDGAHIGVVKVDEAPDNAEIAVRLSELTMPDGGSFSAVIGRDDLFVDSMSSGLLQRSSPLLLVPPDGPVGDRTLLELARLDVRNVIVMGGPAAVGEEVIDQLEDLGFSVERRQGASRFETAIDVAANDAPAARTVLLTRAFADEGSTDPTRAWADSVAVGAMAADLGIPVLLTLSDALAGPTREYLADSAVEEVFLVGGTAALSVDVEEELQAMGLRTVRIAGQDRFETAVEVAKARGLDSIVEVARVVLVDGQDEDGWAAGFAAAGHAADAGAPVLLSNDDALPPATTAFLTDAAFAQTGSPVAFTCVVAPGLCQEARELAGQARLPTFAYDPSVGSVLGDDETVEVTIQEDTGFSVSGPCLVQTVVETQTATTPLPISSQAGAGPCALQVRVPPNTGPIVDSPSFLLGVDDPIVAMIASEPDRPTTDVLVDFSDESEGPVVSRHWDFGDGDTSTARAPRHLFREAGTYEVTLTVTGIDGTTAVATRTIDVSDAG